MSKNNSFKEIKCLIYILFNNKYVHTSACFSWVGFISIQWEIL
jgi:hypothetical protein